MTKEEKLGIVKRHVAELMEHFDTVQIFASKYDGENDGSTISIKLGDGNWFARYGQVIDWINEQENSSEDESEE